MKGVRIIVALVAILATTITAGAQSRKLNMPDTQMCVSAIFQHIREQTHLGVAYRTDQIDPERTVTLPQGELTLEQVIAIISEGTGLEGVIDGNVIVFNRKKPVPIPPEPIGSGGFVPTPLSEFKESLGPRPKSVLLDGDGIGRAEQGEMVVEVEMPMESHIRPVADYIAGRSKLLRFALKTNLLYGLGTLTPNLSAEFGLGKRTSLELGGSYNPWKLKGTLESNRKLVHMILKPEFRYWLCERFDGHFFGLHALYARYNIGTYRVPLLFDKSYRYDGHAVGAGITYGYNWAFHKRWGVEFAIGAGAVWMTCDRYDCALCSRESTPFSKWYFGPTNGSVSLVFLIK